MLLFENTHFSIRPHLPSTLQRSKTFIFFIENLYVVQSGDSLKQSAILLVCGQRKRSLWKALTSFTSLVNTHKEVVVFSYCASTFSRV